jgi:hypothetical protein
MCGVPCLRYAVTEPQSSRNSAAIETIPRQIYGAYTTPRPSRNGDGLTLDLQCLRYS